mmetsp:Transcript_357/g.348  ORF Transcript_357/g.348 Transcript_357/m.348 type:complete len:927 (+) Transcript_357:193-2973(+)|eukprot:CAMPEP_0182429870 /NCGR_PEP_ID=MMETSP1167-20130531/34519_1 /TAXON_ID=2988 /ORGANISM="Mallomonas Sp, Strain CCMP3275" /LENGTH=926 /DNA_ID=CAMNT_0024614219 /DNA_START=82 /DNA_END=2862 /DNA_ORIENTATION=-
MIGIGLSSLFLVALFYPYYVQSNVIGIDFGSDNFKVAIVQPGDPLDIVTNFQSKRKTPSCVAFYRNERTFGSDATAIMGRKPELTFTKLRRILGRTPDHPSVKELKAHYFPYDVYTNDTNGCTAIKHAESYYTAEELIAMLFQHAKDMTKNHGGKMIRDCVITVPSSFTQRERTAMFDAADIADMKVLTLMEENTAAALHFGMDRVFETPHRVLFYNMGASEVQVSIVTYSSYLIKEAGKNKTVGQFEVVGKGWDNNLGSFNFDIRLTDLLASRFNTVWGKKKSGAGKDVREFLRPMTRLRGEATKVREVLSANNEYPVKTEQLHADTDLITKVTRSDFEKACEDLYPRFTGPVEKALEMANMTLKDINAVEMLGGGVRMPRVKRLLEEYFKAASLDLGQHLNGDEAMALGSAFRAANLSTAFRVRKVGVTDTSSFGVSIRVETLPQETGFFSSMMGLLSTKKSDDTDGEVWQKHASLYPRRSPVPAKTKTVAFQYDQDILCKLEYDDDVPLPEGTAPLLAVYNISGIAEFAKESASKGLGQPKVHLSFGLDSSGIVSLTKAEATVELPLVEEKEEVTAADNSTEAADNSTTSEEQTNSTDSASKTGETGTNSTETEKKKKDNKDKKKKKEGTLRRPLQIVENPRLLSPGGWSPSMLKEARSRLRALDAADQERKEREAALNELEGYLYATKNRIMDDEKELSKVSTEEQRTEIVEAASSALEWLEDEGINQDTLAYKEKLQGVRSKAEKVFTRYAELKARPAAVEKAKKAITDVRLKVADWSKKLPQITDEEKAKLLDLVDKADIWIDDKVAAQAEKPSHEDPVFLAEDVPGQLKLAAGMYERLLRKPKPPPEKKAANSTSTANTTTSSNSSSSEAGNANSTERVEIKVEPQTGSGTGDSAEPRSKEPEKTDTEPQEKVPSGDEL